MKRRFFGKKRGGREDVVWGDLSNGEGFRGKGERAAGDLFRLHYPNYDSLPFSLFLLISPSPVPMDAILSRLAQLEQQAHLQDSCIAQLNSTVSSLSSQNEAQASTIARLSSEIGTLRKINQDQELVIGELSRAAIPGGHWVWESRKGGRRGRKMGLVSRSSLLLLFVPSFFPSREIFLLSQLSRSTLSFCTGEVQGPRFFAHRFGISYLAPLPPRRTPLPHLRSSQVGRPARPLSSILSNPGSCI